MEINAVSRSPSPKSTPDRRIQKTRRALQDALLTLIVLLLIAPKKPSELGRRAI